MDIVRIGRASDNDVVFSENEVSRHHCELFCSNGKVYIRDVGSTNGTQVNGGTITSPLWLKKGDKVVLGHKVYLDWYATWTRFYKYSIVVDDMSETIRFNGNNERTIRNDGSVGGQQDSSNSVRPMVEIPSSIHIKQEQQHAEVLKSGDDFKVPFKRNLGNNIGHHVGNTLGCIISILIVAAILAIVGLIMS